MGSIVVDLREAKMGLNYDIQPPGADKAIGTRERQTQRVHDLGNAYGGGA